MIPSGGGHIPLGSRADFMIRCPQPETGKHSLAVSYPFQILSVSRVGDERKSDDLDDSALYEDGD